MHHSLRTASPLDAQAQRQLLTHWRVRVGTVLEQLENEIRRMLRVESALEQCAKTMVERLGPYRAMAEQLPAGAAQACQIPHAPFEWVAQGIGVARQHELKARYRQLAKSHHPDFAGLNDTPGMQTINDAYAAHDLAALIRLEAQSLVPDGAAPIGDYEDFVRQVELAVATYRQGYTQLLNSPLYSLYARAASAQEDGWDFTDSVIRRVARAAESHRLAA